MNISITDGGNFGVQTDGSLSFANYDIVFSNLNVKTSFVISARIYVLTLFLCNPINFF